MFRRPPRPVVEPIRFLDDEPTPAAPASPPTPPTPPVPPKNGPAPKAGAMPAARRREWPITTLSFLAVFLTGLMMRGAGVAGPRPVSMDEELGQAFTVGSTPEVVVETYNGPIDVVRGESGKVECMVTRRGSGRDHQAAEADLENVAVAITKTGDTVKVAARRVGRMWGGNSGATVRLRVPDGATVRLKTSNAPITVNGIDGPVEARTSNGRIGVQEARGALKLTTTNGGIACEATDAVVTAESNNDAIEFRGSLAPGQTSFRTNNGRVTLKLPSSQRFRLDARASNGKVDSEFALNTEHESKKHLVGTVGDAPAAAVKIRTSNGGIRILENED